MTSRYMVADKIIFLFFPDRVQCFRKYFFTKRRPFYEGKSITAISPDPAQCCVSECSQKWWKQHKFWTQPMIDIRSFYCDYGRMCWTLMRRSIAGVRSYRTKGRNQSKVWAGLKPRRQREWQRRWRTRLRFWHGHGCSSFSAFLCKYIKLIWYWR